MLKSIKIALRVESPTFWVQFSLLRALQLCPAGNPEHIWLCLPGRSPAPDGGQRDAEGELFAQRQIGDHNFGAANVTHFFGAFQAGEVRTATPFD
jgi:hypothetical protein